jgi:diguanylate cyclase (GGDEF)-like protein
LTALIKLTCRVTLLILCALSRPLLAAPVPTIDLATRVVDGQASLAGTWGLAWGSWIPLNQVQSGELSVDLIELPNYLANFSGIQADKIEGVVQGYGTYLVQLNNLNQAFEHPSLMIRYIQDAWQAWWVDSSGEVSLLGHSGQIAMRAEDQEFRHNTAIVNLPSTSQSGTLVIYLSAYHTTYGGLYSELTMREQETTLRMLMADLAVRSFLIAVGLYVTIQNLVFYLRRPQEKTLLLLALLATACLLRAALTSGYVDYFVARPSWATFFFKAEYLMIVWPPIAALHMMLAYFPVSAGRRVVALAYAILALTVLATIRMPFAQVTLHLWVYQLLLLVFTLLGLLTIVRAVVLKLPNAKHFLLSSTPLVLSVLNDIVAGTIASYNFYVSEYGLFLFLFVQTQIQSARFVDALKTSEHLSGHLNAEVALKTHQLRLHNDRLTKQAEDLSQQHNEIKLSAETDHLTGLLNRQTLDTLSELQFQLAVGYRQPLALVIMDLDHFKAINDTHGHLVGDECLIFVASFLRSYKLRKRDVVARFGGEELLILLADTHLDVALKITQELCDNLAKTPVTGDHPDITLTASFGIAERISNRAHSVHQLIGFADQALYQAKRHGRNRVEAYNPSEPEAEV